MRKRLHLRRRTKEFINRLVERDIKQNHFGGVIYREGGKYVKNAGNARIRRKLKEFLTSTYTLDQDEV